jgi:adenylate cyclase
MRLRARPLSVAVLGGGCLAAALLLWAPGAFNLRDDIREVMFDRALPLLASPPETSPVVVVDIDRESLARYGAWPWRRQVLADLVRKIAEAKPRVIGLDMLLSEPDRFSPIGLVRNLGTEADRSGIADLARKLPDGDAALADALKAAPVVLGFVLEPGAGEVPPGAPILARRRLQVPDIWQAGGAIGPVPAVASAAHGLGAIVLADDVDGHVRRVPLLVLVGDRARPGFAAEVLRVGYDASSFIADTVPQRLHIGPLIVPIDADAALRILPRPADSWRQRTISAARILAEDASRARLAGRIVLVGSGAPEVGGLRATPVSATTPTVQIQADAIETLSGGAIPQRPPWVSLLEILGALVLGLAALALAMLCRPVTATAFVVLLCVLWAAAAAGAFRGEHLLVDMAGPPVIAIFVFAATALGSYARNERRERALRRRFEQHLAPDIVRRLVDDPDRLRLDGEARQVTAMFTDIEGFTALTERSDARDVLKVLDDYLAIVTDIVIEHGGMVDKLIGDGMFALFNVPLDLANHVERAVGAAQAIIAATESYRKTTLAAALALGRTRIGIETGTAIVGDVGGGNKIDFTAFGNVVNTASRLEGLNKDFNTSICIGPSAAAVLGAERVERLASVQLRGTSTEIEVFTVAGLHSGKEASPVGSKSSDPVRKADGV